MRSELRPGICSLLEQIQVPDDLKNLILKDGLQAINLRSLVVSSSNKVLCAAFWESSKTLGKVFSATILADEDHPAIETSLDALLYRLSREACLHQPGLIQLLLPNAYVVPQQVATRSGFVAASGSQLGITRYERFAVGKPITAAGWKLIRGQLIDLTGFSFPEKLPDFQYSDSRWQFRSSNDNKEFFISLSDLETALSPTVFILPSRKAVLIPIRKGHAGQLLGTSHQLSLLPGSSAMLFHERVYFSASKNAGFLPKSTLLVFYESGAKNGRSAAIAIGRVRDTTVSLKKGIPPLRLDHGVLAPLQIEELTSRQKVAVTTFDNVIALTNPVPLKKLREMGCIDGANLVSARRINHEQLAKIVKVGMNE